MLEKILMTTHLEGSVDRQEGENPSSSTLKEMIERGLQADDVRTLLNKAFNLVDGKIGEGDAGTAAVLALANSFDNGRPAEGYQAVATAIGVSHPNEATLFREVAEQWVLENRDKLLPLAEDSLAFQESFARVQTSLDRLKNQSFPNETEAQPFLNAFFESLNTHNKLYPNVSRQSSYYNTVNSVDIYIPPEGSTIAIHPLAIELLRGVDSRGKATKNLAIAQLKWPTSPWARSLFNKWVPEKLVVDQV